MTFEHDLSFTMNSWTQSTRLAITQGEKFLGYLKKFHQLLKRQERKDIWRKHVDTIMKTGEDLFLKKFRYGSCNIEKYYLLLVALE